MWLPETACNDRVLDALIEEGLRYVILAPNQARRVGDNSSQQAGRLPASRTQDSPAAAWTEVNEDSLDTSIAYRYSMRDDPDKPLAVFFYHGSLSRGIAFESLLRSSREMVNALAQSATGKQMVNIATDGETYGHHFKFGDLCLAHTLTIEAPQRGFTITNYGEYLDAHPPAFAVEIDNGPAGEGTSWSCSHGTGRWIRDCGCRTGGAANWNQQWRQPLRRALDFLRDENIPHFEATRGELFTFPWLARDESISLILDPHHSREQFLFEQSGRWMAADEKLRALTYLELQRMLLLMYTSCGWFFNDISGIETIQILTYAARAIDLMEQLQLPSARSRFLEILSEAKSNRPEMGTGADIYLRFAEPANPTYRQVVPLAVANT
jgi:alpha-amylase/alpha-mannosidase (GH57 family)